MISSPGSLSFLTIIFVVGPGLGSVAVNPVSAILLNGPN